MIVLAVVSDVETAGRRNTSTFATVTSTPTTFQVEDGDATAEDWTDPKGMSFRPDLFWKDEIETLIAAGDVGPCMRIELHKWSGPKWAFLIGTTVRPRVALGKRLPGSSIGVESRYPFAAQT